MQIEVSALLFQERVHNMDMWVAQCLEYDIVAEGGTLHKARENLAVTLYAQADFDTKHGKEPFDGIERAPDEFQKLFNKGEQLLERHDFSFIEKYDIPKQPVIKDARVFA